MEYAGPTLKERGTSLWILPSTCTGFISGTLKERLEDQVLDWKDVEKFYKNKPYSEYMPPSIPDYIASRVQKLHGNPMAWWVGQIVKYICRPVPEVAEDLHKTAIGIGFSSPVVG